MWQILIEIDIYKIDMFASPFYYVWKLYQEGPACSIHGFEHPDVQAFIHRKDLHFDLVLADLFLYESWYMFAHHFKAPIVGISKLNKKKNDRSSTIFFSFPYQILLVVHNFMTMQWGFWLQSRIFHTHC